MHFEDWYRWNRRTSYLEDYGHAIKASFYARPNISDGLLGCDDIGVLRYLAVHGSVSAALHLKRYYSEGLYAVPSLAYKYACYSALLGDEQTVNEFLCRKEKIRPFFPEDLPFMENATLRYGTRRYSRISDDAFVASYPTEYAEFPADRDSNAGYRHPDSFGRYRMFRVEDVDPMDLVRYRGYGNIPRGRGPDRPWPANPELHEFSPDELDATDRRFFRDVETYLGYGTERDEDSAMADLLALAKEGNLNAMDMISYAIGYEPDTFMARLPDDAYGGRQGLVYRVADGHMLVNSPEWRLLMTIAGIDTDCTYAGSEFDNGCGGYEDDVICSIPRDLDGDLLRLVFKPSGYTLGWRGLSFCQSENLSMGEIRRVLRLCIEHMLEGRDIPYDSTKSLISGPMHVYSCPETDAELRGIAKRAPTNLIGWVGSLNRARSFEPSCSDISEDAAVRMLKKLEDREWPNFWDQVQDCVEAYAEFHEISIEEAAGMLCRLINNEDFREEASIFARMNLAELMSALRGIVVDSGRKNPPTRLPKSDGAYVITELSEYFDYRVDRWAYTIQIIQ